MTARSGRISRRRFICHTTAGAAASAWWPRRSLGAPATRRPNIVMLLTDDQRWDALGCAGHTILQTPSIDGLAREGVLFRNAYVTTSICCVSRASIFTGQHSARHGIFDFTTDFSAEQRETTYFGLLRQSGYRTGFVGKFGVGKVDPEDAFDEWHGFQGQGKFEGVDENGDYLHLTERMGRQAVSFLDRCSADQPFCLSVSFKAPHVQDEDPRQFVYDRALKDLYADAVIPEPATAKPEYWDRFPDFFKENNEGRKRWEMRFSTPEKFQEMVKGYFRLITGVDRVVGRIREKLAEKGLADNTVILFTSDNGFYLGEHGLAGKWWPHEESIRVPMILFDPRVPAKVKGSSVDEMALNIDVAPTLLALAGLDAPPSMQGISLAPVVRGDSVPAREDFYYHHDFLPARLAPTEGVLGGRYKYWKFIGREPEVEYLHDIQTDPMETRNLADSPEFRPVLESMRKRLEELRAAAR